MKTIWERYHLSLQKFSQLISERLYVPSQTGSHDMGSQHLGDLASSYIEHQNFPVATHPPFRGIKISRR
jgi:hypothetical protein